MAVSIYKCCTRGALAYSEAPVLLPESLLYLVIGPWVNSYIICSGGICQHTHTHTHAHTHKRMCTHTQLYGVLEYEVGGMSTEL